MMTCPCSRSRFRWLRTFCSLICLIAGCCSLPSARAQDISKPSETIDDDVTAFAYAPDGRIVYSVRRLFKTKKFDLQRDDIWIREPGGHRRRIFEGQKFTVGDKPFSYLVEGFRWSPDQRKILVALNTASISDDSGATVMEPMALVLEDSGKQLNIGTYKVLHNAISPTWLPDSATIVYFSEAIKPDILFSFHYATLANGPGGALFEGRTFLDYDPLPGTNSAIAIERDRNLSGPPRIQRLDLLAQDNKELATLDGFDSGLTVSPSGKRIAYYIDKEVLEVRDLEAPNRCARIRIGLGVYNWMPDERAIILKRSPEHKSGDLVRIAIPPLAAPPAGQPVPVTDTEFVPLLHDLTFRDFAISPDGQNLAVVPPGKRNLLIFPLPRG
ncbi:MAG TPA: hypothetical protein VLV88_00130 [Terriglobales bacterium]|nr:hypothetical protein [Terriglobales bacterium]